MKITNLLVALVSLFVFQRYYAQCTSAIELTKSPTCVEQTINISPSTTTIWLKFNPYSPNEVINYHLSPSDGTQVSQVNLYQGTDCSSLNLLTIYDSLETNDSIVTDGLNTDGNYFLEFVLSNRKDAITLTICKTVKTTDQFWDNYFYTSSGVVVDCQSGIWLGGPTEPTYEGNDDCQSPTLCINDVLFLELNDYTAGTTTVLGAFPQVFEFLIQNGATYTQLSPTLGKLTFSQTGTVTFHCGPDEPNFYGFLTTANNNLPDFVFTLTIVDAPPVVPTGTWSNGNSICANSSSTFTYTGAGTITSILIDGVSVPVTANQIEIIGANYDLGNHIISYTVSTSCGTATYSNSFSIVEGTTSLTVDNCGNATLTFFTCEPVTNPNTQHYQISWGDGSPAQNGTYSGSGYTVTHHFIPGTYTTSFFNSYLPNGSGNSEFYDETFPPFTVNTNPITITGPAYSCELTSPISINGTYTSVVWSTIPAGLPFAGQGTNTMTPNASAWASQNNDIVINVTATDANGCVYEGTWTTMVCCKPIMIPSNEYFELTYYAHTDPTNGLSNKLPANAYNGPASASISLAAPPSTPIISTPFSTPMNWSTFMANYSSTGGFTVSGSNVTINRVVYINNSLIIDQSVNIINSHYLRFGPNGAIVLNPGISFAINNSTLAPYCGQMWQGIVNTYNNSSMNITNTNIIGAINGIKIVGNGGFKIETSRFIDNYKGITITDRNTTAEQTLVENYFGDVTSQNLMFPYSTLLKTYSGVHLTRVQNMVVGISGTGRGNLYHNIQEGVRVDQSKILIVKNTFYNINETLLVDEYGVGVHVLGKKGSEATATIGTSTSDLNVFYSCERGVRDFGFVTLNAQYNLFKDIKNFGFELFGNSLTTSQTVRNNTLNSTSRKAFGVYVKDFGNATNLIELNTFNVNIGPALALGYDLGTAIYIGNINSTTVTNTQVLSNTINWSRNGVHVINTNNPKIKLNTINMNWSNSLYTTTNPVTQVTTVGILAQNSAYNEIWSNSISHNASPAGINFDRLVGIRIELSPYSYVWKNTMTRMSSGFYALGSNFRSRIQCNEMNLNNQGFRMDNAYISRQGAPVSSINPVGISAHNRWVLNIGADGTTGTMLYPTGATQATEYYHSPSALYSSDPSVSIDLTYGWNDITLTSGLNTCGTALNQAPIEYEDESLEREADYSLITQNTPLFETLDLEMRHFMNAQAYGHLKHTPALINMGNSSDTYYQNYVNTGAPTQAKLQVLANDYLANKQADSAAYIINQYATTEVFDVLLKDVQTIWNNAQQTGIAISASDSSFLYSVACSDPLTNGAAVYVARNILDWDGNCPSTANKSLNQGSRKGSSEELRGSLTTLYPVPNNGSFTIESLEKMLQVDILDANGKLLESHSDINSEHTELNTKLKTGFYLVVIHLESNKTETLRFVVE